MRRILSTKKLLPNQRQYLLNAGFGVVDADFIEVRSTPFAMTGIRENLIFTSANAVRSVAAHPKVQSIRRHPVFCVGDKTADVLDEVGFTVVENTDYGADLAQIISGDYAGESFTFFCGNLRLDTIPNELRAHQVDFNEICVYETALTPQQVSGSFDAIMFYSPSGVESFLKVSHPADAVCICIGTTTAAALSGVTSNVVVANRPLVENVIVQTINYYKDKELNN